MRYNAIAFQSNNPLMMRCFFTPPTHPRTSPWTSLKFCCLICPSLCKQLIILLNDGQTEPVPTLLNKFACSVVYMAFLSLYLSVSLCRLQLSSHRICIWNSNCPIATATASLSVSSSPPAHPQPGPTPNDIIFHDTNTCVLWMNRATTTKAIQNGIPKNFHSPLLVILCMGLAVAKALQTLYLFIF